MRRYTVQKLAPENFRRFGTILEKASVEGEVCPPTHEWHGGIATVCEDGAVSVNILTIYERPFVCQKFESHKRTTENLIPLDGKGFYAALAPAGELDPEKLEVFYVPGDKGISLAPGVWHYVPHPVGATSACVVVFRRDTGKADMYFSDLPEPVGFEL